MEVEFTTSFVEDFMVFPVTMTSMVHVFSVFLVSGCVDGAKAPHLRGVHPLPHVLQQSASA